MRYPTGKHDMSNDEPLFDSDVDPKRIKNVADGLRRQGEFESARMLDGYADLLEAREKAVPVAWRTFDGEGNYDYRDYENNEHYRDWYVSRNGAKYANWAEPLYTHSAQAQPPAASVTDAMVEDGCMAWNKSAGLGYAVADRDCMRAAIEAALAAQENPNG
jgi:hypothetical protein